MGIEDGVVGDRLTQSRVQGLTQGLRRGGAHRLHLLTVRVGVRIGAGLGVTGSRVRVGVRVGARVRAKG